MRIVARPEHPRLPSVGGKVQPSDLLFPLALAPWLIAGLPGLRRVAGAVGVRDVMRFRFLWIALLGLAAGVCARRETSA